ncbi:MAG: DMT family transporter [Hyphomicrobiales bacterium]
MELWVIIAIGAAFLQNLRSAIQKTLKNQLSNWGATAARFIFAAPLALIVVFGLSFLNKAAPPTPNGIFFLYAVTGGFAQIAATALLLHLFSFRNFAVGTIFSKTETVQSAVIGLIVLNETISSSAILAICLSMVGLILISLPEDNLGKRNWIDKTALIGLASGACFAIAGVTYRAASLSLPDGDFLMRAAVTLAFVTSFQAVVMCLFLRWKEPGQITRLFRVWRLSGLAGMTGGLASLGWFAAMTLQKAVFVKAVGQIEIVFSFAASILFFKETIRTRETIGIVLISAGIVLLVLIA